MKGLFFLVALVFCNHLAANEYETGLVEGDQIALNNAISLSNSINKEVETVVMECDFIYPTEEGLIPYYSPYTKNRRGSCKLTRKLDKKHKLNIPAGTRLTFSHFGYLFTSGNMYFKSENDVVYTLKCEDKSETTFLRDPRRIDRDNHITTTREALKRISSVCPMTFFGQVIDKVAPVSQPKTNESFTPAIDI